LHHSFAFVLDQAVLVGVKLFHFSHDNNVLGAVEARASQERRYLGGFGIRQTLASYGLEIRVCLAIQPIVQYLLFARGLLSRHRRNRMPQFHIVQLHIASHADYNRFQTV